jgi:hypothetical protein
VTRLPALAERRGVRAGVGEGLRELVSFEGVPRHPGIVARA